MCCRAEDPRGSPYYAITKMMGNPRYKPSCAVMTIARGLAILAFAHSSLRWKGASYPDIVHMTLRKPIMKARPLGLEGRKVSTSEHWQKGCKLLSVGRGKVKVKAMHTTPSR